MAIKMTPSELRDLAAYVTQCKEDIVTVVGDLNSRVESDTAEWDGDSKEQYFNDYNDILPALRDQFPQIVEQLAERLTYAADTLEDADKSIASSFKG